MTAGISKKASVPQEFQGKIFQEKHVEEMAVIHWKQATVSYGQWLSVSNGHIVFSPQTSLVQFPTGNFYRTPASVSVEKLKTC